MKKTFTIKISAFNFSKKNTNQTIKNKKIEKQ